MKPINEWDLYVCDCNDVNLDISNYQTFKAFKGVVTPCLFEDVLKNNGVLGDIYYSTNMLSYKKYETYHQIYRSSFKSDTSSKYLILKGIDTISEVFVNGKKVGNTDNQFLPFTFKLENLKKENELVIHIIPNVVAGRSYDLSKIKFAQPSNYESIYLRKTASSFGWDILPRTCLGGIFSDVFVCDSLDTILSFNALTTFKNLHDVTLTFEVQLSTKIVGELEIRGSCKDSTFAKRIKMSSDVAKFSVNLKDPYLWTIRGFGDQNLYDISLDIICDNKVVATKNMAYGIRKIELKRSSVIQENGSFEFHINDKKVFLLGSNYVPTEALKHIDNDRMQKCLEMVTDIGCNALRVWGGGTYETDEFYSLCDKLGIFVWQDFMMGCAIYPNVEPIMSGLRREAIYEVNRLKSYACICLWAGDNECDIATAAWTGTFFDPNENKLTREVLPSVLNELDPTRPFLPSSPYVDEYAKDKLGDLSEDHLWGPRDYFKGEFYTTKEPYFTSETGYHALNSPKSLQKFISNTWPLFSEQDKPTLEYLVHSTEPTGDYKGSYAYRTSLMTNQIKTLFGKIPDNLNDFAVASQISQGEAVKFFIEKMRYKTDRNGGIIWWNILDGWPQVSDAVVDYYFCKKAAYYYIKNSQAETLLFMMEDNNQDVELCISSITNSPKSISYEIFDGYTGEKVLSGVFKLSTSSSEVITKLPRDNTLHFYVIKYKDKYGNEFINHFHTRIINIDLGKYVQVAKKYGLLKVEGF